MRNVFPEISNKFLPVSLGSSFAGRPFWPPPIWKKEENCYWIFPRKFHSFTIIRCTDIFNLFTICAYCVTATTSNILQSNILLTLPKMEGFRLMCTKMWKWIFSVNILRPHTNQAINRKHPVDHKHPTATIFMRYSPPPPDCQFSTLVIDS